MYSLSIQAGGKSTRMGTNKALIPFNGVPLIQRIVSRLRQSSDDLYITSNSVEGFESLGIPIYPDVTTATGALGGLITALHYARHETVAVAACDLPFILPALLDAEAALLEQLGVDVVIPRTSTGLEPLLAVYRVGTCLPAAMQALEHGKQRMISWFDHVKVHQMDEEAIRQVDPLMQSFINLNTPQDLQNALLLVDRLS